MSFRRALTVSLLGFAAALLPAHLAAQICTGMPSSGGELTVAALANTTEGIDGFGAMLQYNSAGRISPAAGFTLDDYQEQDDDGFTLFGRLGVELNPERTWPVEVCAVGTALYTHLETEHSFDGTLTDERYALIGGVGLGREFPVSPSLSVGAYAIPALAYVHASQETEVLGNVLVAEDEATDLVVRIGGTVRYSSFSFGVEYNTLDLGNDDGTLGLHLAYHIGLR